MKAQAPSVQYNNGNINTPSLFAPGKKDYVQNVLNVICRHVWAPFHHMKNGTSRRMTPLSVSLGPQFRISTLKPELWYASGVKYKAPLQSELTPWWESVRTPLFTDESKIRAKLTWDLHTLSIILGWSPTNHNRCTATDFFYPSPHRVIRTITRFSCLLNFVCNRHNRPILISKSKLKSVVLNIHNETDFQFSFHRKHIQRQNPSQWSLNMLSCLIDIIVCLYVSLYKYVSTLPTLTSKTGNLLPKTNFFNFTFSQPISTFSV